MTQPRRHITDTTGIRTPLTAEALVTTVRRHVTLLKEDPQFFEYVMNLALYLLEVRRQKPQDSESMAKLNEIVAQIETVVKPSVVNTCHVCGSPTEGKRICPNCHHMVA